MGTGVQRRTALDGRALGVSWRRWRRARRELRLRAAAKTVCLALVGLALALGALTLSLHDGGWTWRDSAWPAILGAAALGLAIVVGLGRRLLPTRAARDVRTALDGALADLRPPRGVDRDVQLDRLLHGRDDVVMRRPRRARAYVVSARPHRVDGEVIAVLSSRRVEDWHVDERHASSGPFDPAVPSGVVAVGSWEDHCGTSGDGGWGGGGGDGGGSGC